MRHLGIDYGKKRIGIAISDEEGRMAFPHRLLHNSQKTGEEIKAIIEKENISKIVLGESKDYHGRPNEIMKDINKFKQTLEKFFSGEIVFQPEFMTSVQAEKGLGSRREDRRDPKKSKSNFNKNIQTNDVDVSSAVIILQSYLDMRKNS